MRVLRFAVAQNIGEDGSVDKRQFHDICKSLLKENYIVSRRMDGSFELGEYKRPFDESSFITPYGVCLRAAVKRLDTQYQVYQLPARSKGAMKAWHLSQRKGQPRPQYRVAQRHGAMHDTLKNLEDSEAQVCYVVAFVSVDCEVTT